PARIRRVVDAAEVDEVVEAVVLHGPADVDDAVALDDERDLPDELLCVGDRVCDARDRRGNERILLDLVRAAAGRHRGPGAWSRSLRSFGHQAPSNSFPASSINFFSMSSVSLSPGVQSEMSFVSPVAIAFA